MGLIYRNFMPIRQPGKVPIGARSPSHYTGEMRYDVFVREELRRPGDAANN